MKKVIITFVLLANTAIMFAQSNCYDDIIPVLEQYYKDGKIEQAKEYIKDMEQLCAGKPTSAFIALKEKVYAYGRISSTTASNHFTQTVNGVSFKMIYVEGSSFDMGRNDGNSTEKPVHRVKIKNFYMGETEVTQALWNAVMGNNPSHFKGDNLPVESISWNDAQVFIAKLNRLTGRTFRLPTEAEWEYAARGGNKSKGYTYSGSDNIDAVAWYGGNAFETHHTGRKQANELGLFDMSGNVFEWCQDRPGGGDYTGAPIDGSAWIIGDEESNPFHVMRGGAYMFPNETCRTTFRFGSDDGDMLFEKFKTFIGFRLVL